MGVIPLLFRFIAATMFKRGELNISSSSFNPVKLFIVIMAMIYVISTSLIIFNLMRVYHKVEYLCPGLVYVLHNVDVTKGHRVDYKCLEIPKQKTEDKK